MDQKLSEWLERVKEDLISAKILLTSHETVYAASVFHSHQAVEKTLKSYLFKEGYQIPKTHNLMRLLAVIIEGDTFLTENIASIQRLDNYYPRLRYPTGDKISKEDAVLCLNIAEKICLGLRAIF